LPKRLLLEEVKKEVYITNLHNMPTLCQLYANFSMNHKLNRAISYFAMNKKELKEIIKEAVKEALEEERISL